MEQKKRYVSRKKTITLAVLIAVLAIGIAAAVLILLSRAERSMEKSIEGAGTAVSRAALSEQDAALAEELGLAPTPAPDSLRPEITMYYDGKPYAYNDELSVLLIIGVDDRQVTEYEYYHNHSMSDFLLLAVFDPRTQTCLPIQLNRDTMADIPFISDTGAVIGTIRQQLALAHSYGRGLEDSCQNTVDAVSMYLYNIDIDNYFALTMEAIPQLNDLVGGVTVPIEDDFTGVDDTLIQGETVTLSGEHTENYVRSRMSMQDDPTNLARMRRQRTFMAALLQKLRDAYRQDSGFLMRSYESLSPYLVTDCSLEQLSAYADRFADYTVLDIVTPAGEASYDKANVEFYADEDALQKLVVETFYIPVDE